MTTTANAQAVSRALNAAGLRTRPSYQEKAREGLYVRRASAFQGGVSVSVAMDTQTRSWVARVTEVLQAAGFVVTPNDLNERVLYVAKADQPKADQPKRQQYGIDWSDTSYPTVRVWRDEAWMDGPFATLAAAKADVIQTLQARIRYAQDAIKAVRTMTVNDVQTDHQWGRTA